MLSMLSTKVILSAKYCNSQLKMTTVWTTVFKWRKYKKQNVHCLCYLSPLCRGIWFLLDCLQSSFSLHWLCSEHGSIGCAVKGAEEEMFYLLFYLLSCSLHTLHFHLLHDQWRELRGTAHSLGFYKMLLLNPYHSCYLLCRILSLWLHRSASCGQLHPARLESESVCYQWQL